jgi:hypothetical protein
MPLVDMLWMPPSDALDNGLLNDALPGVDREAVGIGSHFDHGIDESNLILGVMRIRHGVRSVVLRAGLVEEWTAT